MGRILNVNKTYCFWWLVMGRSQVLIVIRYYLLASSSSESVSVPFNGVFFFAVQKSWNKANVESYCSNVKDSICRWPDCLHRCYSNRYVNRPPPFLEFSRFLSIFPPSHTRFMIYRFCRIVKYSTFLVIKSTLSCSKCAKKCWWPGLHPGLHWGSLKPLIGWEGTHPPHFLPLSAPWTDIYYISLSRFEKLACLHCSKPVILTTSFLSVTLFCNFKDSSLSGYRPLSVTTVHCCLAFCILEYRFPVIQLFRIFLPSL